MEEYFSSSSEESSSSASDARKDNIGDKIPDHSHYSDYKGSPNNPGMQQPVLDQPPLDRCPFCCFQAITEEEMQDHLVFHFTESAHQCQCCSIWITSVPEWYLHLQCYHLTEDLSNCMVYCYINYQFFLILKISQERNKTRIAQVEIYSLCILVFINLFLFN